MRKHLGKLSIHRSRRRRLSPLALVGITVSTLLILAVTGVAFAMPQVFSSHAADAEHQQQHHQKHKHKQDEDQQPAVAPVVPNIPPGSTVGLWFGFNGNNLTLQDMDGSLQQGNCVNGSDGSIFGQFAYCNAPAFFQAANAAMAAGKINPNPAKAALGMGKDGLTCPSVRDFGVVDQDQSDNVTTTYMINGAQQANGSDNRLLAVALDGALGCTPLMAPDLAHPGQMTTALPLNELQAATHQAAPRALVPLGDPMTLLNNEPDAAKTDIYRMGVDQPLVAASDNGNTTAYCNHLFNVAPPRLVTDALLTGAANSPDPSP